MIMIMTRDSRGILLLLTLLVQTICSVRWNSPAFVGVVAAFQAPPHQRSHVVSSVVLKASTIDESSTTTTTQKMKKKKKTGNSEESKRLSKAKLLLEQFQRNEMDEDTTLPLLSDERSKATTKRNVPEETDSDNDNDNNDDYNNDYDMEDVVVAKKEEPGDREEIIASIQKYQASVATTRTNTKSIQSSSSSTKTTTTRTTSKTTKTTTTTTPNNMDVKTVVPDTYWRNAHLQPSSNNQVVTRWSRGANVAEPLVKYDPVAAEQLLFRQPTKWIVRNVQIAVPLGVWAIGVIFDYFLFAANNNKDNRRNRAKQLRDAISSLGPAIIKGGQALASRPDLLPAEYLEELQSLQDDVPRFSNELAIATVEQELNINSFSDLFELEQEEPVAAASIGQVYKARLVETGDVVALKIQRPACEEIVALDLYILRWWSGVYNQIFKVLQRDIDLQSIIDDFGELIYRELDYVAEASNAQRFNELYAGVTDVFVPKIYSDYTTSRVLTMEWVDGYRVTDLTTMRKLGLNETKLIDTLVQCSLRQILENGFFHADPHAGNLLACPDGRLCYLDFGMMSYANQKQRNGFLLAVIHIINKDWNELAKLYVSLGFIPEGTDLDPIVVALDEALPDVLNSDISELNFKNVINSLGDVFYTFPFSLPPFYIAIIRCLGVLEGLAIQVDPNFKVLSECYPYVASRVLTDRQEDLQEAFRRLALTPDGKIRWERLEQLLDEANDVSDYDAAAALDLLTDYLLNQDNSDQLISDLAQQVVDYADSFGMETAKYLVDALRAFAINDEVAAVRAFRSFSEIIASQRTDGFEGARKRIGDELRDGLPELTPSMKRVATILSLAGSPGMQRQDMTKFVPIIRKLAASQQIQRSASEVLARLGERMLSRGLRAVFGLPPPAFGVKSSRTTVTEDQK